MRAPRGAPSWLRYPCRATPHPNNPRPPLTYEGAGTGLGLAISQHRFAKVLRH